MFVIVRHSERLDEVDQNEWREYLFRDLNKPKQTRHDTSVMNDPPITKNGMEIAYRAGDALSRLLPEIRSSISQDTLREEGKIDCSPSITAPALGATATSATSPRVRLYSSRLLRCIQTTLCIAKRLGVNEIYVSSGLAQTAAAVERMGDEFDFISFEDILQLTDGTITIYDCDQPHPAHGINSKDWFAALYDVSRHTTDELKVIVAHRETIRHLLPIHPRLPYCAIAVCKHLHPSTNVTNRKEYFHIPTIYDSHGNILHRFAKR